MMKRKDHKAAFGHNQKVVSLRSMYLDYVLVVLSTGASSLFGSLGH